MADADPVIEQRNRVIGSRIRQAREKLGWSQVKMAEELTARGIPGMVSSTIGRLESGARAVRLAEAPTFASTLDVSVADLIADDETDPITEAILRWIDVNTRRTAWTDLAAVGRRARNALTELHGLSDHDMIPDNLAEPVREAIADWAELVNAIRVDDIDLELSER